MNKLAFSFPTSLFGALAQRMAPPPKGKSAIAHILTENKLRGRDILGIEHLNKGEIELILDVALQLKANKFDETQTLFAKGQTLAMIFEKPSLRTRVTFESGMTQLGGHAIYLEGRIGVREPVMDVSKNLDRWVDGIMARTFEHATITELADNALVPVINGLSDREHPCQALADFMTIIEHKGKMEGLKMAFVGDGNNVAHSLMLLAAKVGTHFTLACPSGFEPFPDIVEAAMKDATRTGARIVITHDPAEAVADADVVYTDTWVSMGQEEETAKRLKIFEPFQVNSALMELAKPNAIVMHCLPAHRGQEVTAAVLDGPQSVIYDEAENRLHAQKAVMSLVM
jgi:ornithine carbamoyltransferase